MKKIFSLILGLILCLTIFNMPLISDAEEEFVEEKVHCEVNIDDDFSDERVIVVLRNEISRQLRDYTPEDFPEIDCEHVRFNRTHKKDV